MLNLWFTFIIENQKSISKKLIGLFLNSSIIEICDILEPNIEKGNRWYSTDEKCSSAPSLDYLFCMLPDDYNFNRLLELKDLQMIVFNKNDKIIYGTNLSKVKHKAKLCIGDYGLNNIHQKIEIDALETLQKSENNNAKHALIRYYDR